MVLNIGYNTSDTNYSCHVNSYQFEKVQSMFLIIKTDTVNLKDISRISRSGAVITVYFISKELPVKYDFNNESDATEVEYKIFKNLEEHGLIV